MPLDNASTPTNDSPPPRENQISPHHVSQIFAKHNIHAPISHRFTPGASGNADELFAQAISQTLAGAEVVLQTRSLTDIEVEALVLHQANYISRMANIQALSTVIPLAFAWRTRKTFKFPFYQPKWIIASPDVLPSRAQPIIKGPPARMMWHLARFGAYSFATMFFFQLPYFSWATMTKDAQMALDPRLRQYARDVINSPENMRAVQEERRKLGLPPVPIRHRERPSGQQQEQASADSSEESSNRDPWEEKSTASQTYRTPSESQSRSQQYPKQPSKSQSQSQSPPSDSRWDDAWDAENDYDDGSPVAPSHRSSNTSRSSARQTPSEPGTSWEKIRAQALSQDTPDKSASGWPSADYSDSKRRN